jgi:glutathione-regulated potassium-efflux system protein KefB
LEQQNIYNDEQKIFETHRNALAELEHLFESDAFAENKSDDVNLRRGLDQQRINVARDESE